MYVITIMRGLVVRGLPALDSGLSHFALSMTFDAGASLGKALYTIIPAKRLECAEAQTSCSLWTAPVSVVRRAGLHLLDEDCRLEEIRPLAVDGGQQGEVASINSNLVPLFPRFV